MKKYKVLVLGIDEYNLYELSKVDDAELYEFIPIFKQQEIQNQEHIDIEEIISKAKSTIREHDNEVDAIISFFDFPFTLISFYLSDVYNLRGPRLMQGLKCEHKYWSRLLQKAVIPGHIPGFDLVNPYKAKSLQEVNLEPPFWLKPVKSYSSILGFKIENEEDFTKAIAETKNDLERLSAPFNTMFGKADLPPEIADIDGNHCLAEAIIEGHQATLSGYMYNNKMETYGIVDSINYPGSTSFFYYLYPSELSEHVKKKMHEISEKVMKHIGFNNSPFNIEFFYDKKNDSLKLLEINPRMSQSHGDLYRKVKKYPNHQVLIKCALGEKSELKQEEGAFQAAAKLHYRAFDDGTVERVPSEDDINKIKNDYPDAIIQVKYEKGEKLSSHKVTDSYSYNLATLFIGGQSKEEILTKYEEIIDRLDIRIKSIK